MIIIYRIMKIHMKKNVWLAIIGVGVLCIAIFYYMFVYRFSWDLDDGTLSISGKEEMPDYHYNSIRSYEPTPWDLQRDKIKKVIIEDGVTRIGNDAFYGCFRLKSVTIPNTVTKIGRGAFWGCSALTSIEIPNSVTDIEEWAFQDCSKLRSIICKAKTPPFIYWQDFFSCPFYCVKKTIPVFVPAESVDAYKEAYGWNKFTNIRAIE